MKCQIGEHKCQVGERVCQVGEHKCQSEQLVYPAELLVPPPGFTLFLAWKRGFTFRQPVEQVW